MTQTFTGVIVALRRKDQAITVWALGFGGSALGLLLLSLAGLYLSPFFTPLGNVLLASFEFFLPLGLAYFLGIPRPWRRYIAYVVVLTILMAGFSLLWPSYPIRSSMTSAFFVLMTVEFLVFLALRGSSVPASLRNVLLVTGIGFVLFHGIRSVSVLFSRATSLMSDVPSASMTFVVTIGFSVLWGGLLLVLDAGRLQAQVSTHNDKLTRLNRLKDRLLAMTSHDLRGPLGNLQVLWGELSLRIEQGDCSEVDRELLQMVDKSLAGTQSLLENLFSFAELQGARVEPMAQTDLVMAISTVLDQCASTAMTKRVELRREGQDRVLARAGFEAVVTVLRNLVGNAVKFTPSGGRVTVCLKLPDDGKTVVVEVADTGIGMPSDLLEKALRMESRVSRPGTDGERGSGFGLVLVRELVDDWGGSLSIDSSPGNGARVQITFPRVPA